MGASDGFMVVLSTYRCVRWVYGCINYVWVRPMDQQPDSLAMANTLVWPKFYIVLYNRVTHQGTVSPIRLGVWLCSLIWYTILSLEGYVTWCSQWSLETVSLSYNHTLIPRWDSKPRTLWWSDLVSMCRSVYFYDHRPHMCIFKSVSPKEFDVC